VLQSLLQPSHLDYQAAGGSPTAFCGIRRLRKEGAAGPADGALYFCTVAS